MQGPLRGFQGRQAGAGVGALRANNPVTRTTLWHWARGVVRQEGPMTTEKKETEGGFGSSDRLHPSL